MILIIVLYMLIAIVAACLCELIQMIGKVYIGPWSSFISSGENFRYNYVMYFVGLILYFVVIHLLYKVLLKKRFEVTEMYTGDKVFHYIVVIVGDVLMIIALVFVQFWMLGMTDNIGPEVLFYATLLGWPIATMVYLFVRLSLDM